MGSIVDKGLDIIGKGTGGWFGLDKLTDGAVSGYADEVGGMFSGAGGGGGGEVTKAERFNLTGGAFGGGAFDPSTGTVIQAPTEAAKGLSRNYFQQLQASQARQGYAGSQAEDISRGTMSELGTFDPFSAAEEQFGRLDAILEPGRAQARAGGAAALLQGGRLGSTGGARETAAIEGEIERQRQGLLSDSFMQAQDVQDRMVSRATGMGAFGLQQRMGEQAIGQGALQGALSIDAQQQAALGLGSNISKPSAVHQGGEGFSSQLMGGLASAGGAYLMSLI